MTKEETTKILQEESNTQQMESYKEGEINWFNDDYNNTWEKLKTHLKFQWGDNQEYFKEEKVKWILPSHSRDTIKGKPQLIEQVQKKIPLVKLAVKKKKAENKDEEDTYVKSFYFFDDGYDKRYHGQQVDSFSLDFWFYRVVSEDSKEYYIFSQKELPNETCVFKGMLIEMDDFAEISRSMKIKSLSRIFIMKDFEPSVKILTKKEIVDYTKKNKVTEEDWLKFLALHEFGSFNRFPNEMEMLRSAFILCGRSEGWPLHLAIMGPAGTRKTMGHIETISHKFSEDPSIIEGGDSRIKTLSPSFKEKPANIGYLARCERMGWVDEIGKMIEFETNKHQMQVSNVLGELNFLLEHKKRTVGSGNDNECRVQANSKFMFVTNPVSDKNTIYSHVGIIDSTTMSRIVWWIQDQDEQRFVLGPGGIVKNPPHTLTSISNKLSKGKGKGVKKSGECWGGCLGMGGNRITQRDDFLTLFDTCYSFLCVIDDEEVEKLATMSTNLAKEPMKTSVWKPRAPHHIRLIIDGLIKHRCLFKDYDESFEAKQEDYDMAERILIRMVKSWETDLGLKKDWEGEF